MICSFSLFTSLERPSKKSSAGRILAWGHRAMAYSSSATKVVSTTAIMKTKTAVMMLNCKTFSTALAKPIDQNGALQ